MSKEKKAPDLRPESVGISPYTDSLIIYATKKMQKVLNTYGNEDIKEYDFEATPYTKVFEVERARLQVCELPLRSKELYLDIIHAIRPAQDCFWLEPVAYMKRMGITSVNTFKVGLKGLTDGNYIQRHSRIKEVYWINPYYFFKGSRLNKYPKNIKYK